MPLLYSVVARGTTILANYATYPGNFTEVSQMILSRIAPEDGKMTLSHNAYLFHYVNENKITYMCITDDEFERSRAFLFLNDIKAKFTSMFGAQATTAIAYAMNDDFSSILRNQIKHFSEAKDIDTLARVQSELEELKDVMVKNVDQVAERGENIKLLYEKAGNLNASSVNFRMRSRNLRRSLFWKNVKIYALIGTGCLFLVYIILAMSCGGLALSNCV